MTRTHTERQEEYRQYLLSDHWHSLRARKLKEANFKCQRCDCDSILKLEVHHKTYRSNWLDTDLCELEVLCHACHQITHGFERAKSVKPDRSMPRNLIASIRNQKQRIRLDKKSAIALRIQQNLMELRRPFGSASELVSST